MSAPALRGTGPDYSLLFTCAWTLSDFCPQPGCPPFFYLTLIYHIFSRLTWSTVSHKMASLISFALRDFFLLYVPPRLLRASLNVSTARLQALQRHGQNSLYFSFQPYKPGILQWVKVAQSCLTLCDSVDYTVHGILQAKMLECV